jgi:hypothetical protein
MWNKDKVKFIANEIVCEFPSLSREFIGTIITESLELIKKDAGAGYHKRKLQEFRARNPTYHRDWTRRDRARKKAEAARA